MSVVVSVISRLMLSGVEGGGGAAISPILQAGLDYIALKGYTPLSDSCKEELNATFSDPLFVTLYNAAPRIYIHRGDFDSDVAGINWKNPSDSTNVIKVNSPTYTNKGGFSGGGTAYLDYQWNPSTQGEGLFTQDNAAVTCYAGTNVSDGSDGYILGSLQAISSRINLQPRRSTQIRFMVNDASTNPRPLHDSNNVGLWAIQRISSTQKRLVKNGAVIITHDQSSVSITDTEFYALTLDGSTSFYHGRIDMMIPYQYSGISDADIKSWWDAHLGRVAA